MSALTEQERSIITHALTGSNRNGKVYRNYFLTDDGDPELEALVQRGYMRRGAVINEGVDRYYRVTDMGALAVGLHLPKEA